MHLYHIKIKFYSFLYENSRKHEGHRDHHVGHHSSNHHNMNHRKEFKHEDEETETSAVTRFFFGVLWCFAQVGLWGSVLLFLYWVLKFDKGFAWTNDKRKQFNLHSFLMIAGFIFLNGQGINRFYTSLTIKVLYINIKNKLVLHMFRNQSFTHKHQK